MTRAYRTTPEDRARKAETMRRTLKRLWQTPTYREKMLKVIRRNARNPAFIAARATSPRSKAKWADPEYRAAMIAALTKWTLEDDNILRAHYGKNSARQLAWLMGTTRNAVIGRARRLGLSEPAGNHRTAA